MEKGRHPPADPFLRRGGGARTTGRDQAGRRRATTGLPVASARGQSDPADRHRRVLRFGRARGPSGDGAKKRPGRPLPVGSGGEDHCWGRQAVGGLVWQRVPAAGLDVAILPGTGTPAARATYHPHPGGVRRDLRRSRVDGHGQPGAFSRGDGAGAGAGTWARGSGAARSGHDIVADTRHHAGGDVGSRRGRPGLPGAV
ncbi:MAG: hypothetical protein HY978_01745 [Candidatus Liptonbacteria bacterium]|nr:hypothetical protein [Candidatus Liptonbacteria bacterium]